MKWKYKVELGFGESSPAVAAGKVIVGDLGGIVHAVNVADGKAAWTFKTRSEVKSSPVVVGDVVLIGSYDGTLYGLGLADGKQRWEVKTNNYVHGTPAVLDGVAYFAGCDEVFRAVRASDGKIVFEAPIGAYTGASVALDAGTAYFGTFDNEVLALDLKTHRFKWRYKHPEREFPFYSSAAVASGKVIVGGRDKMIHAIDATSGKAGLDLHDARAGRVVAGGGWLARLRRVRRRPLLRASIWRPAPRCGSTIWAGRCRRRRPWPTAGS